MSKIKNYNIMKTLFNKKLKDIITIIIIKKIRKLFLEKMQKSQMNK